MKLLFPQPKTIECPCCKSTLKEPSKGAISRCPTCKSEIIAHYEYEDKKPGRKVPVELPILASVFFTLLINLKLDLNAFSTFVAYILVLNFLITLINIPQIFSLKAEKPKVTYGFVGGLSYPEQQIQKHNELIDWLDKATDDIIGFCRYISKSKYVDGVIGRDSLEFFQMLEKKTALLPANHQIDDWQEHYLSKDLAEIEHIKTEFGSKFELHIDTIIGLANQVDYFSDITDGAVKEGNKTI